MIIYKISLPANQNSETFLTFMREEYFPAVHKGATRVGQVTDMTLMQQANEHGGNSAGNEFLWLVGWSGLPTDTVSMDNVEVGRKFEAFQASLTLLGFYNRAATWPQKSAANSAAVS